jgi:hypothetical protein
MQYFLKNENDRRNAHWNMKGYCRAFFRRTRNRYWMTSEIQHEEAAKMIEVIGGGLVLIGIAYAENRGWVDKERVSLVLNVGMQAGICASMFYLMHKLAIFFL